MSKKKNKPNKLDEVKFFDTEEENLDFPKICKFIRHTLNVTQEQMAQKLNITTSAYAYWEYGKYVPKSWQAFNLCLLYLHAKEEAAKQEALGEHISNNNSEQCQPMQNQAA